MNEHTMWHLHLPITQSSNCIKHRHVSGNSSMIYSRQIFAQDVVFVSYASLLWQEPFLNATHIVLNRLSGKTGEPVAFMLLWHLH